MRRKARVDANQAEVVAVLRAYGVSVQHLHGVAGGCPDILCGYRGMNFLFEIKDPAKRPSARALTADQVEFHEAWRGQVHVAETAEAALRIMRHQAGR